MVEFVRILLTEANALLGEDGNAFWIINSMNRFLCGANERGKSVFE